MKKFISLLFILLLFILNIEAASYSATLSLSSGASMSIIEGDSGIRLRYYLNAEAEPAGISFGSHMISLPIHVTYFSSSAERNYILMHQNVDVGLGLSYRYSFTDLFTLRAKALVSYRIYNKIKATAATVQGGLAFEFYPDKSVAITIPLDLYYLKDEFEINIGLGCLVKFGGER